MTRAQCLIVDAGLVDHADAERWQQALVTKRRAGEIPDLLLLVEHPEVVTVGRGEADASTVADLQALAQAGVPVRQVARGGGATFHGPGQIVGYPIVDLREIRRDLHWYLRTLEETQIRALARFGWQAERRDGFTGVWVEGRKIASIGVAVRGWVTWHGFALNVACHSPAWESLNPCGLAPDAMASLDDFGRDLPPAELLRAALAEELCAALQRQPVAGDLTELLAS